MKTVDDILRKMREFAEADSQSIGRDVLRREIHNFADRIEAAEKRKADRIHRAMVLIAGIEMEDPENPPRLWTALEDAYDALSDALGTDGDTSADVEETKAIGRYFVVKTYGNSAKMREALSDACYAMHNFLKTQNGGCDEMAKALDKAKSALSAPHRNCDLYSHDDALRIWSRLPESKENGCFDEWLYAEAKGDGK